MLGAWDNAKKYIGGGAFGGKGSDDYKAAVVGRVGDVLLIPYSSFSYSFLPLLLRREHCGGSHEGRLWTFSQHPHEAFGDYLYHLCSHCALRFSGTNAV